MKHLSIITDFYQFIILLKKSLFRYSLESVFIVVINKQINWFELLKYLITYKMKLVLGSLVQTFLFRCI